MVSAIGLNGNHVNHLGITNFKCKKIVNTSIIKSGFRMQFNTKIE